MPESGTYGSVRGALSNERPYRDNGGPDVSIDAWSRSALPTLSAEDDVDRVGKADSCLIVHQVRPGRLAHPTLS
jgi:hypothetical protein